MADQGGQIFTARALRGLDGAALAPVLQAIRQRMGQRPVYLCWDMDIFDPAVAPGVCTPTWGGLSAREGIELLRECHGLNIVAIDFNTVSPPQDIGEQAAFLCAHMVMEAMLLLSRRLVPGP